MSSEEEDLPQDRPEPSMEEILASIRRIISEDEAAQQGEAGTSAQAQPSDFTDILELTDALPPEAKAQTAAPTLLVAGGDIGLTALVTSLLEPHLKAWLDAHLPEIVEKMVAAEIARIRQAGDEPSA